MEVAWTRVVAVELDRSERKDWGLWVGLEGVRVWGNEDVFLGYQVQSPGERSGADGNPRLFTRRARTHTHMFI